MSEFEANDPNKNSSNTNQDLKTQGNDGSKTPAPQVTEVGSQGDGKVVPPSSAGTLPQSQNTTDEDNEGLPDELSLLKQRAKVMGISHSGNIGLDALKTKIAEHIAAKNKEAEEATALNNVNNSNEPIFENTIQESRPVQAAQVAQARQAEPAPTVERPLSLREHLRRENMKLIRLRITNMDPKKAQLPGEILTVANDYIGTVRKFIPYGEATDNGFHVPYCLYKMMKDRMFLQIRTSKKGGKEQQSSQWVREFALEELEPLSEVELARLGAAQAAAGGLDGE